MNLLRDGVWWLKCAMWAQIDRFVAWVIERNNRFD